MPLYEFACLSCQQKFEQLVPSFRSEASCPKCGGHDVEKLLSTFAMSSGGGSRSADAPRMPAMAGGGGGCCGGGCGCH
ncbi:MAG: zinc ribbon domain-containing protein [Vicinamibacteria bacterium]|jgi:putative FmdB family regulatory protein|nr:zinc ribbon domain-containing protein [Vicinamibacteria bacterium]